MSETLTQQILHEDVSLYVFMHGHAESTGMRGDLQKKLSPIGIRQAERLGKAIAKSDFAFDQIICSAALRAQETALIACAGSRCENWYMGKGLELYSPKGPEDHRALHIFYQENPDAPYCAYRRADTIGIFSRFMTETRGTVASIPGIGAKRHIAIFGHRVMNNAIVEAFFPQHAGKLWKIEIAPCDRIRATKIGCWHVPISPL